MKLRKKKMQEKQLDLFDDHTDTNNSFSIDLSSTAPQSSYSIDSMNYSTVSTVSATGGIYTIGTGTGIGQFNNGWYANPMVTTTTTTQPTLRIEGNGIEMPSEADIKIGNRSLREFMEKMEERMAILQVDPKKLEKFEALKRAYENYKLMEKLCQESDEKK